MNDDIPDRQQISQQSVFSRFVQRAGSVDILHGPITPTLWKFSLPLMFSFVVNMLYAWTDTYYVSRLGATAIAALGMCDQLNFFIFTLASGFAIGSGIVVARRIGEGNPELARETALQAMVAMLLLTILLAIILMITIDDILLLIGLRDDVRGLALDYMTAVLFGLPGNLLMFQINAIIRSTGNSIFPMKVMLLSTFMNAVITPFLVFGIGPFPELGIMGAGMGTAIAQMLGASIAIVALVNGRAGLRLPLRIPTLNMTIISTIARLGLPSSFQMLVVSVSRAFFFSVANIFGTSAIAAYTLGLKVDFLVFMPIFAFATAIEIITGQHLGAKKVKRIFEFYRAGLLQLGAVIVTLGALAYIFAPNIASIFTDDADVIAATVGYLRVAVFGYPLFLFGVYSVRLMSGAGATVRSMIITAGNVAFLQAPLVIMLSQWTSLHETGIWLGILIGYAGMATFGYINVMGKKWITARV